MMRRITVTAKFLLVCLVVCWATAVASHNAVAQNGAQNGAQDTLESIDRVRGGRHWIDIKTDPPRKPEETLASFKIEPGYRVQLVAAEPIVRDPVAVAFDELGRMYAVEYTDYPIGPEEEGADPLSKVVMLEDTDGDGVMDRRHVFADKLSFAHSLLPIQGGILVGAQSQIVFLKDTDNDHVADVREVWFDGFVAAHPQMQIGNPRWGLDNWIYLNYGPGKIVRHRSADGKLSPENPVVIPRLDFRFNPQTMEFDVDNGLGQFGNTVDKYGYRYFTTNRNPIMVTMLSREEAQRNPFVSVPRGYTDVGPSGGDTRVYPLVAMKSNWLSHAGTHTSACGVTAYKGGLFAAKADESSVFVCEPVGHLVTHSIVHPDGAGLNARRAQPKADFLASNDTWFRPASLATGPDGALYLADMYRLWVEHPKFLPPEIAARIDWRAGEDRGRIWRILPVGTNATSYTPPRSDEDLLRLLSDENGWRRKLAQRLIVEGQKKSLAGAIGKILLRKPVKTRTEGVELGRLHALWTLDGLGVLADAQLKQATSDPNSHVRRAAVKLLGTRLGESEERVADVGRLVNDSVAAVRYNAALALGKTKSPQAGSFLAQLAKRDGTDTWLATALLTSSREHSGHILQELVKEDSIASNPAYLNLVRRLAEVVGARGDLKELSAVLSTVGRDNASTGSWWQTATLRGLATGLTRYRGELGRLSLAKLLNNPPAELSTVMPPIRKIIAETEQVALDASRPAGDRVSAIELLTYQAPKDALDVLRQLLSLGQAVEVQRASIEGLRQVPGVDATNAILGNWLALGPTVRGPALEVLMARDDTTKVTLTAMKAGTIAASAVGIDRRVRLLRHGNAEIRGLAAELFGGAVSADRVAVAKKYAAALTMPATLERGTEVYAKNCAQCHKINGKGHQVGPDISDVRNRARDALLYDILDPNRKVEPRFNDYTVALMDGRVVNGLLVTETAKTVVLRQAEGKELVIERDQIDEMVASGKSLMPEGVEKTITVQQMADLLEYLKGRKTP